jgi:5-methylcytosine-specific restriction protein A
MTISKVTAKDVARAIAECDSLGVANFLAKYGYRASLKYVLRHNRRDYPSKAILGVAAGLAPKDFSGGAAHTSKILGRLGYKVVAK